MNQTDQGSLGWEATRDKMIKCLPSISFAFIAMSLVMQPKR